MKNQVLCPICRTSLIREVVARAAATVAGAILGAIFGRGAGAALGAPIGMAIGDAIEKWICQDCNRSFSPWELRGLGENPGYLSG